MTNNYNRKVTPGNFDTGDLVSKRGVWAFFLLGLNALAGREQPFEEIGQGMVSESKSEGNEVSSMRFFRLIGSHPPNCKGKCGTCTPCTLTREQLPPSDVTDPAPERWMCKCGNKLYDPYGKI
ncbi:hypothetical protein MTR_4g036970 [Medicago truncatula]|uniref:Epidermal patterning factor-like protein n=1 Tax=Medicago truncatula TaxID=3880 RepID=A0A072UK68_MEDTR|nr:hypothetical protein MTR_4g036970 [Medicago truncatula]